MMSGVAGLINETLPVGPNDAVWLRKQKPVRTPPARSGAVQIEP